MECIRAVSSPQTNAPEPSRISMSKREAEPRMPSPSRPCSRACSMAVLQPLDGQRVLGPHVDVALARRRWRRRAMAMPSTTECGSDSSRLRSMYAPGSPSSPLPMMYFGRRRLRAADLPLRGRGEARAPASAQPARLTSSMTCFGRHRRQRLLEPRYRRARGSPRILGIDEPLVPQDDQLLLLEERQVRQTRDLALAGGCAPRVGAPRRCRWRARRRPLRRGRARRRSSGPSSAVRLP